MILETRERADAADRALIDSQSYASAILSLLEDAAYERTNLENTQRAILNILDDSASEALRLGQTQQAVLNILDDFEIEKMKVEQVNVELRHEIAEREIAAQALRLANVAVESSNRELEAFSYSVAHDLRAPLRSIDGFSQALLDDCADKLDESGKTYLRNVREAAQRMARLITDLLSLSRVTRADLHHEPIDLAAIARTVIANVQKGRPGRAPELVLPEQLAATGDPRLILIVLENLLDNAWKFSGGSPQPKIELGRLDQAGPPVYFVRDNGAGFDMAYSEKLFAVFQRLHGADEFDGLGIGLATVQRIILRHGGRIWAEGQVGQGATFYFTLGDPA